MPAGATIVSCTDPISGGPSGLVGSTVSVMVPVPAAPVVKVAVTVATWSSPKNVKLEQVTEKCSRSACKFGRLAHPSRRSGWSP